MNDCIFCKIVKGEIPSQKVYEDEEMLIFKDIAPIAKIHLLCIPKEHFAYLSELNDGRRALLGRMIEKIASLQAELGLKDGYRLVVNQGDSAGHILGGETLPWG